MKMHLRAVFLATLAAAVLSTATAETSAMQTTAAQPGAGWSALESYTGTIVVAR
jgi:nitrous oxidase accessory protein NosD